MRYELVIFDCDGTFLDTARDVARCFNETLEEQGFSPCEYDVVAGFIGKPLEVIVEGLLDDGLRRTGTGFTPKDVEVVSAAYKARYAQDAKPNTRPFPGIVDVIDDLLASGIRVAVNSNKPEPALLTLMQRWLPDRPITALGYVGGRPTKPDPAGVFEILRLTGVDAHNAVYVGDTQIDFNTAQNAGVDCVLVKWGQGSPDLFENSSAVACCDTAGQLAAVLKGDD